jgi:hypothetical protein
MITIAWAADGDQLTVDRGDGPQPVDDIGAALQLALDAYREGAQGRPPGQSAYESAFSGGGRRGAEREPTDTDAALARRA